MKARYRKMSCAAAALTCGFAFAAGTADQASRGAQVEQPRLTVRAQEAQQPARQPSATARRLLEKYAQGDYAEVAREGPAALAAEEWNHELRLGVANSLAWTGQTSEAVTQYERLAGSEYDRLARLGLAHLYRWSGRPDRAAASYRRILASAPDETEAQEGLRLARRELRPKTIAQVVRAGNSSDAFRTGLLLGQRWRDASGGRIFELAVGRIEENKADVRVVQRDLTFRFEDLNAPLAPQLEISTQEAPDNHVFAAAALRVADAPAYLTAGHINWGKLAFDPRALRDGLTANQIGGRLDLAGQLGNFGIAYDAYRVSDDNLVHTGQLRIVPAWQPFGSSTKLFTGVEGRKARFDDPRYWSPVDGHYIAFLGVSGDWASDRWQNYGSLQYGVPLGDESGSSWSVGGGAKRWLGEDWAVGVDLWAMNTPRDGGYRASSGSLRIERLW